MTWRTLTGMLLLLFVGSGLGRAQGRPPIGPKDGPTDPPTDLDRVKVGAEPPDFTLESLDGRLITLSSYRGQKNVVLVFYRGHW